MGRGVWGRPLVTRREAHEDNPLPALSLQGGGVTRPPSLSGRGKGEGGGPPLHRPPKTKGRALGRTGVLLAALVWVAASAGAGDAPDWPHLRGPSYNAVSVETGIVETWPEAGPPVLWRARLGQGYSAFIAVGEHLYTQAQSLAGQFVLCLDADTGRVVWRHRYGWPWEPDGDWPGPMATPTYCDDRLYFAGAYGLVGCLKPRNGRPVWSVNVTKAFEGRGTELGYACSPLVEGGKVFLPVGGEGASVVALDARDGSVAWASGDEVASYSPALPITIGGRRQIVAFLRNVVAAYDPATGRQLWLSRWSESYDEHAAWPVYEEPYLLTCSAFRGGARVLKLRPDGPPDLAWESRELSNDIFSSLVLDGHVYGFDLHDFQPRETRAGRGLFKCLKLATGEVRWSTDRTGHANVLAADGKLILFSDMGELILARATPARYEELARTRVFKGEVCWTAPALHRKRLYVRNQSQAACIYLGDPAQLDPSLRQAASDCVAEGPAPTTRLEAAWAKPSLYAPTLRDVLRWYGFCMAGVFAAAGLLGLVAEAVARRRGAFRMAFGVAAFALGAGGTLAFSHATGDFVFTWPVSVFVAYQGTLIAAMRTWRRDKRAKWVSRAATLGFVGLSVAYATLCRSHYIPMGYGFLVGILPAAPVAGVAAWELSSRRGPAWDLAWSAVSFTAYFWVSGLITVWRTHA